MDVPARSGGAPVYSRRREDFFAEASGRIRRKHAFGKLAEGRLHQDGRDIGQPALPGTLSGQITLSLRFANGALLAARGRSLVLSMADDAHLSQDLSC